ncbi:MAG: hypothetical protein JXJ19_00925 [Elusimicrobia bacterium]|nr:hypothetical protein [Elusimicrobiota bacterium]
MRININRLIIFALMGILLPVSLMAADDVEIKLNSADGSTKFAVRDSADAKVAEINSDGSAVLKGSVTVSGIGDYSIRTSSSIYIHYSYGGLRIYEGGVNNVAKLDLGADAAVAKWLGLDASWYHSCANDVGFRWYRSSGKAWGTQIGQLTNTGLYLGNQTTRYIADDGSNITVNGGNVSMSGNQILDVSMVGRTTTDSSVLIYGGPNSGSGGGLEVYGNGGGNVGRTRILVGKGGGGFDIMVGTDWTSVMTVSTSGVTVISGDLKPVSNNTLSLGSDALEWKELWATDTSINTGDLAERFFLPEGIEEGTVVTVDTEKDEAMVPTRSEYQVVTGIVSKGGVRMGDWKKFGKKGLLVGEIGNMPCRVTGPVKRGDILVASSKEGRAMAHSSDKPLHPYMIVGIALQENETGEGIIKVLRQ